MPNLLALASQWSDDTDTSPPAVWDGTKYAFTEAGTLTYNGTVTDGDTLSGTVTSTSTGDYDSGHHIQVLVNGVDALTWDFSQQSYPPGGTLDITLAAGDTVEIVAQTDGCGYPPEFNLAPPPAPVPIKRLQFEVRMEGDPEGTP